MFSLKPSLLRGYILIKLTYKLFKKFINDKLRVEKLKVNWKSIN